MQSTSIPTIGELLYESKNTNSILGVGVVTVVAIIIIIVITVVKSF